MGTYRRTIRTLLCHSSSSRYRTSYCTLSSSSSSSNTITHSSNWTSSSLSQQPPKTSVKAASRTQLHSSRSTYKRFCKRINWPPLYSSSSSRPPAHHQCRPPRRRRPRLSPWLPWAQARQSSILTSPSPPSSTTPSRLTRSLCHRRLPTSRLTTCQVPAKQGSCLLPFRTPTRLPPTERTPLRACSPLHHLSASTTRRMTLSPSIPPLSSPTMATTCLA